MDEISGVVLHWRVKVRQHPGSLDPFTLRRKKYPLHRNK